MPAACGDLLHPRLRALEPRGGDVGTEREPPARAHRVGGAGDERAFRPDDHDVDVELVGELRDRVGSSASTGTQRGDRGDARVPRRGDDLGRARRAQQPPDERVLAPARPDDEELHAAFGSTTV